jgi:hypothetical protein
MKAKKEMPERHLINESRVYGGEGEILPHAPHTHVCTCRLCTGSANDSTVDWGIGGGLRLRGWG